MMQHLDSQKAELRRVVPRRWVKSKPRLAACAHRCVASFCTVHCFPALCPAVRLRPVQPLDEAASEAAILPRSLTRRCSVSVSQCKPALRIPITPEGAHSRTPLPIGCAPLVSDTPSSDALTRLTSAAADLVASAHRG